MRKQSLKKMISESFRADTPDLGNSLMNSCEKETQEPLLQPTQDKRLSKNKTNFRVVFSRAYAVAACLALFFFGILIGNFMQLDADPSATATAQTCVYFDVNPSVELCLDEKNKVINCIAGNEDARVVLAGLKLEGVDMNTALTAIVGSMYVNGYLAEYSNSILISVETNKSEKTAMLLSEITAKINTVFEKSEMECSIIAQSLKVDDDLKQRAEENGISVGKMHFLDKMAEGFGGLSENAIKKLSELSIRDLNLIYSQKHGDEIKHPEDFVSGSVNVAISSEEATNAVIKEMDKTADDVECSRTFFLPSKTGESKVVYAVVVMFYDDPSVYKYEVDCQTGEVVSMQRNG
ncbi:MAG: hypothetical protein J6B48_01305 [Clostridia bacterium]|nr:hypothetical protein [Clostridia bacterium]